MVGLPILTRCRTSLGRDSLAIDRSIRNLLQRAVAVYEVGVDALAARLEANAAALSVNLGDAIEPARAAIEEARAKSL